MKIQTSRVALAVAIPLLLIGFTALSAQENSAKQKAAAKVDPMIQLAKDRETKLIETVYAKTQSAKTATDFTDVIESCRNGLKKKISEANQKYLRSLEAWALNRRGLARCDLAKFMRDANNTAQAKEIFAQAETDFQDSLELNSKNWRPSLGLGLVQAERGDYLAAVESFTKLCESHAKETAVWFNRAELYYQLEKFDKAMADYEQVLTLVPADLQAITGKAHCLLQLGNLEKALAQYEIVSRMIPHNNWALINTADAHQMLGHWKQAYDGYVAAMTAKPNAAGYQKAAWMMATCPDQEYFRPQMAMQLANKAIQLGGETRLHLDTLAAAQAASGDFQAAKKSQELAIAKAPKASDEQQQRMAKYEANEPFIQNNPVQR